MSCPNCLCDKCKPFLLSFNDDRLDGKIVDCQDMKLGSGEVFLSAMREKMMNMDPFQFPIVMHENVAKKYLDLGIIKPEQIVGSVKDEEEFFFGPPWWQRLLNWLTGREP